MQKIIKIKNAPVPTVVNALSPHCTFNPIPETFAFVSSQVGFGLNKTGGTNPIGFLKITFP